MTGRTAGDAVRAFAAKLEQRAALVKARTVTALVETVKGYTPVDTGELRDGWHDDGTAADVTAVTKISNEVDYGPYVEWGTSRMEPRAMMQRTIDEAPAIAERIIREVSSDDR
jgi:hypothetical protein